MTTTIFVEYECLNQNDEPLTTAIRHLQILSDENDIIVFSTERESNRLTMEEWLMNQEVPCEQLLLRGESDYSRALELRLSFVHDFFNGDVDKAAEFATVLTNNEPALEAFREDGIYCLSNGWA